MADVPDHAKRRALEATQKIKIEEGTTRLAATHVPDAAVVKPITIEPGRPKVEIALGKYHIPEGLLETDKH
jgi:hypothetical protein